MRNENVAITLTPSEALVLFEFLSRFSQDGRLAILDQAEQRVLWDIQCVLETQIDNINNPNYSQDVANARAAVRDSVE